MIFQKKNCELIRQNEKNATKPQKHDANLRKNSTIFFQVGLIMCLLITYALFEASFKTYETISPDVPQPEEDIMYVYNEPIKILEETRTVEKKKSQPIVFNNPIVKDDDDPIIETVVPKPSTSQEPMDPKKIQVIDKPDDLPPFNVMAVEQVPIFPGCENVSSNEERRQCMSDKIAAHIQRKFNTNIAGDLGLKGEQRIYVMFKIDKQGHVTDIKTSSKYSLLNKEAERVIGKLPQMTPGKQKDNHVDVLYSLPIKFNVIN